MDFGRSWTDFCESLLIFSSISVSENDKNTAERAVLAQWHAKRKMSKNPREPRFFKTAPSFERYEFFQKMSEICLKHYSARDAFRKRFFLDLVSISALLETLLGPPGSPGRLWESLGRPLGSSWKSLGSSWDAVGRSWEALGTLLVRF